MIAGLRESQVQLWPTDRLVPYARNPRTHSPEQVVQIAASIAEFGFTNPILVDTKAGIIAGHGRLLAAQRLGLKEVPVIVLDHLSETQKRAYVIADNRLALNAGWDEELLSAELAELEREKFDVELTGFSDAELEVLLADEKGAESAETPEEIPEAPAVAVTQPGDLWMIGAHRLLCGDCRDRDSVLRLFEGLKANIVVTSPPYASQREYDPASGFRPVAPEDYIGWYGELAANIESVLAPDGSYFLNIKEHAEDGQRLLYVKELTIAHVLQWGWRFVDELCWRKTDNGVPGGWGNRFKNAWEPIFHFCRQPEIKFRPEAVGHLSDGCFDYSPDTPESNSGSGLLGQHEDRHTGIARPSNVIEAKTESSQGSHSAPFPRVIPEFFIKAFTDPGDAVFDPFLGIGTTMAAAALLERNGYGIEISPAYCDVIIRRMQNLLPDTPVILADTKQTFEEVAAVRGVETEAAGRPRERDSRAIQHRGPAPCYGKRRAAAQ